jgi:N-glycosylase/DNA lyase
MNLTEIRAPDFDLAMTLNSGQVFHWEKIGNGFVGTIGDLPVYVEQDGQILKVHAGEAQLDCFKQSSCDGTQTDDGQRIDRGVAHYFALDHPLANICRSFPRDPVMDAARRFCRGLRIIRQPKWECLATFICSSMKQVAHIRQISRKLRERFGNARKVEPPNGGFAGANDHKVFTFPSAGRLAESSEKELRECALGYRAKNLLATARLVAKGELDLAGMSALSDIDLREALCRMPGVGAKVANCVMLFAYQRLGAFPIDVWIERVLRQNYFPRTRKLNAARLRMFTEKYFGEHGGYAQQYLFHFARMSASKGKSRNRIRERANLSPRPA